MQSFPFGFSTITIGLTHSVGSETGSIMSNLTIRVLFSVFL